MFHKDQFKKELVEDIKNRWLVEIEDVNEEMLRTSLANVIQKLCISDNWINSKKDTSRKVHYFSMEFMIGKQLKTNLVNLNILNLVKEGLSELGIDLEKIFNTEIESKTANGGLGRLAFAIMNGTANIDINACGNGLLYREGIFEQHFIDGRQIEVQDFWFNSEGSYEWKYVQPQLSKVCNLYGEVKVVFENGKLKFKLENYTPVEGIVHEVPIVGFQNT
jgi:starch phosphorylase